MKDRAKSILLPENPFAKVKGHTKIELTEIKSGKKKIIEHDNDFQSGVLAKYMRSMGAFNNNPYANNTWAGQPIWRNLCGGIFCFEDAIDNNNNEVEYMPAGNKMIANGAYGVTNSGTPIELGSYNSIESQTSGNDSITFVYDFNSSQGNGTIGCVCLTTEIGGYIGYGNPSGVTHSTKKDLNANQSSGSKTGVLDGNYIYSFAFDFTTKTITVTRTPVEVSKGSIFDNIAETAVTATWTTSIPAQTGVAPFIYQIAEGKIAIVFGLTANVSAGGTFTILIYDTAANAVTEKTITNLTGESVVMKANSNSGNYSFLYGMSNDYIYVQGASSAVIYGINMTDSSFFAVDGTFNSRCGAWWWNRQFNAGRNGALSDGLLLSADYRTDGYNAVLVNAGIIDEVNHTRHLINSNSVGFAMNANGVLVTTYDNYHTAQAIYKNPLILATVNNLETPVTKTAAQTMKITYTLSKASE